MSHLVRDYPILYKIAKTGKVYEWHIWIEGDENGMEIVTTSGYRGGKMIEARKEVPKGKAGRTVLEQAELEANRKFADKSKKGDYTEVLPGTQGTLEKKVKKGKKIRPMLAQTYDPSKLGKWITLPAFSQRKYDGIRCLAYMKSGKVILESRTGLPFQHFDHIRSAIAHCYEQFELPATFYFDGELYTPDMPFEELSGLVRRKTLTAGQAHRQRMIKFYIFDFFDLARPELTTADRLNFLKKMFTEVTSPELVLVPTDVVGSPEEIRERFLEYVGEGYEGLILRDIEAPYEVGSRSRHLLKYKEMEDAEFEIVGYEEGAGRDKGAIIWVLRAPNGKTFTARPRGSMEYRRRLFENGDQYIGKKVTVIYQELSEDGIPRFPVAKAVREEGL